MNSNALLKNRAYINGEWISADNGRTFAVTNPADNSEITQVPSLGAAETRRAIEQAEIAFRSWRKYTAQERSNLLRRWYELIMANQEELAQLLSLEQGKPLAESRGEIVYGASFIEWFAEEAKRVYGDVIPAPAPDRRFVVIKQPIGVVAAITPWNFPNAMITRKCAPAMAAGCTVVIKPAPDTPLSALALAALADEAGIPPGVFNVLPTDDAVTVGGELTGNPLVRKLSFTGSTAVGKLLMGQCASTVKKISLELGGNAPFLVFDDADIDAAVAGALASKYRNSGQTCVCTNRFLVQEKVYDEFAEKLAKAVAALQVGPALTSDSQQGPLINQAAVDKVQQHVDDAVAKGARLMTGGQLHELGGTFYQPTILADVTADMRIACEETFGPVAPLFRFKTEQEAIDLANDTPFGLAAYFYARDIGRVWRVAEALETGMVGINEGIISTAVAPFGGVKESGIGREGSRYGLDEFIEMKYLCMGGLDQA
ncbi:NAD-dependent succinate-semialdehyde dehydrogenase [Sedimenticola thiotaurini]|uniref:Succinate-semialdehyde dehydrogenase n=1 Tax=Sedimenticola thiotaurini TaxID=1543721 RepID=A0A0F7JVL0_9GAMM|nr:NAD-dependent succinate-semialdehyde dehydrogenase [Sedimenticola thiotaurini]AKH19379.1 succinate-semialdehyde dehydrogenase [Sedimenticola thiotaurini]